MLAASLSTLNELYFLLRNSKKMVEPWRRVEHRHSLPCTSRTYLLLEKLHIDGKRAYSLWQLPWMDLLFSYANAQRNSSWVCLELWRKMLILQRQLRCLTFDRKCRCIRSTKSDKWSTIYQRRICTNVTLTVDLTDDFIRKKVQKCKSISANLYLINIGRMSKAFFL